jgi:hypothetical protein
MEKIKRNYRKCISIVCKVFFFLFFARSLALYGNSIKVCLRLKVFVIVIVMMV